MCDKLFKSSYLQRHEKKFHPTEVLEDDKEWLGQDPGELIGEVSNESESGSSSIGSSEEEEVVEQSNLKMIQSGREMNVRNHKRSRK